MGGGQRRKGGEEGGSKARGFSEQEALSGWSKGDLRGDSAIWGHWTNISGAPSLCGPDLVAGSTQTLSWQWRVSSP